MKIKQVVLDYFPEFRCIAEKCKYSCCYYWRVNLTKNEYTKYRNLRTDDKEMKEKFANSFQRVKQSDSLLKSNVYATIKMKEDGNCPFLTESRLCGIQQKFGYNALSYTCKNFPRLSKVGYNQVEWFCSLGCEQVVNLLLERPNGLRLIKKEDADFSVIDEEVWKLRAEKDPRWYYYGELQALCIGILQNRSYSLSHRLLLLGFVARDLEKAETKEDTWNVIVKALPLLQYSEEMEHSLKQLPLDVKEAFVLTLLPAFREKHLMQQDNQKKDMYFENSLADIKQKLNLQDNFDTETQESKIDFNLENYLQAREHFEKLPYADYLMENVMVQILMQNQFPLKAQSVKNNIWDSYLKICCEYNFFKIFSTVYMMDKENKEDMAHIVSVCARAMLHGRSMLKMVKMYLEDCQDDSLQRIATILQV